MSPRGELAPLWWVCLVLALTITWLAFIDFRDRGADNPPTTTCVAPVTYDDGCWVVTDIP
jgi:hypothetical protein